MSFDASAIQYWNNVFSQTPSYDPYKPLPYPEIERALAWVCESSHEVLDFGCGNGRVILRCLTTGAQSGLGIDLSHEAITSAQGVLRAYNLEERCSFVAAGPKALLELEDDSFDAALLFDIISSLTSEDIQLVFEQIARCLRPGGKLLLKLGGYKRAEQTEEQIQRITAPYFVLEKVQRLNFPEFKDENQLYFLRASCK